MKMSDFRQLVGERARELYRPMPWRDDTRGYYVLVSEIMLQQTQVSRVLPKFYAFIQRFPDEAALASASLAEVLRLWQGLGYNRRAKYLHDAAKCIAAQQSFPDTVHDLQALPGVGKNTAGAIMAYSFNQPAVFIETNIRTVFIHHFFPDAYDVTDSDIAPLLTHALKGVSPREFYWGLMDYGSWLKAHGVRNVSRSHHYKKQSKLEGSMRQMRGLIIATLTEQAGVSRNELVHTFANDSRLDLALQGLCADGLVRQCSGVYRLAD